MHRLERYLFWHLTVSAAFVTIILSAIVWLTQSLRLVELVVEGGAPLMLFIRLVVLTLPTFLTVVLPVALFMAILLTYNRLNMDSELVVMRAAGLSPLQLARPVLVLAFGVLFVAGAMGFQLGPSASYQLATMRHAVQSDYAALLLDEGVFSEVGDGLTVFVRDRASNGELHDIVIHDARGPGEPSTIIAERGILGGNASDAHIVVYEGIRQQIDEQGRSLSELSFDRYALSLSLVENETTPRWAKAWERTLFELLERDRDPNDPVPGERLFAELHRRLSEPLLVLSYAAVAVAFMLSGEFNRRGHARRIGAAVVLVVLLQGVFLGTANMVAKNPAMAPFLYIIVLLPVAASMWILFRSSRRGKASYWPKPAETG